ncbi:hypothetical protein LXL04_033781 [Taraxacum kok-saghyz]
MWILLVMMTIVHLEGSKRVRKGPLPPSVDTTCEEGGSEQDPKLCTLRRRKHAMTSVGKTGKPSVQQEELLQDKLLDQIQLPKPVKRRLFRTQRLTRVLQKEVVPEKIPNQLHHLIFITLFVKLRIKNKCYGVRQRRKRGPNINKKATQVLDNLKESNSAARLTLTRDIYTMKFVGDSATYFATEVGIVIRKYCPLEFHTWEKVPNENKEDMMDRLRRQWKRTRSTLKAYWVKNGGIADPSSAKSKMDPKCRSKEDWEHMCKYWETDKAQKYADQMKQNREKLVVPSRGGSRSIANHKYAMTDKNTQLQPNPIKLYHKLHFKTKWINEESRIEYENIVKMKDDECAKLVSAGITITPEMEYEIEKNAVTTVCSKPKTLLLGWESSSGPVMRKKDIPYFLASESSQSTSKDDEEWKIKYVALEEEQRINKEELRIYQKKFKRSEEKSEKLSQF